MHQGQLGTTYGHGVYYAGEICTELPAWSSPMDQILLETRQRLSEARARIEAMERDNGTAYLEVAIQLQSLAQASEQRHQQLMCAIEGLERRLSEALQGIHEPQATHLPQATSQATHEELHIQSSTTDGVTTLML